MQRKNKKLCKEEVRINTEKKIGCFEKEKNCLEN